LVLGTTTITTAYFLTESDEQRRDTARRRASQKFLAFVAGETPDRSEFEAVFLAAFQKGVPAKEVQRLLDTGAKEDHGDVLTYEWFIDKIDHGHIYRVVVARPPPSAADNFEVYPFVIRECNVTILPST
jgi:hypothetical protein